MRLVKRIIFIIVSSYLLLTAGLYFFQDSLLFLPTTLEKDYKFSFDADFKEINLTNDGATLNGVHFKVENPKGVILYFHGNAGDLSRWGQIVQPLLKFNHDIIAMDYRGYGKSVGQLSESAMYEDAQLYYDYAKDNYPENKIILYGRSLGTTFAIKLAAQNKPAQLILETPFYSIASVAENRFPIFPIDLLLKYPFKTYEMVPEVKCPTLILLSKNDEVVGYENGLHLSKLFKNARVETLEAANHNNQSQFALYWSSLADFLNRH